VSNELPAEGAERLHAQIAIIGSGPGGAITANEFAKRGRDVILIEEGPDLSLNSCAAFSREEMVQKYRNGGVTVALGTPNVVYVEGRCVGGGSEINSAIYHRTPPEILERWSADFEVEALTEADLRPHFEACESELGLSTRTGAPPGASLRLREGASMRGSTCVEMPRMAPPGLDNGGRRASMTETILPRARRSGCRLLPDTRVMTLTRRSGGFRLDAEQAPSASAPRKIQIDADVVFVCGGAVQTPALLRRSGVRRRIGDTLKLQPMIKVVARFDSDVNHPDMRVPADQVGDVSQNFSFGCSISTRPHLALAMSDHPDFARETLEDWRRAAVYYAISWGGSGSVRALPIVKEPLVRYRLGREDLCNLSDAVRELSHLLLEAGATEVFPTIRALPRIRRPSDLDGIPRPLPAKRSNLSTVHLSSSCPMGEKRARCAVNSFGQVHDQPGLYVSDASILCGAPGVNPQGTIMAFARRNALAFLGEL
jgi:choline dehydrogenase-like flavoprotein